MQKSIPVNPDDESSSAGSGNRAACMGHFADPTRLLRTVFILTVSGALWALQMQTGHGLREGVYRHLAAVRDIQCHTTSEE